MHLLRGPNETQMDMIRDELNEDAERIGHLITIFHKWIAYQPHLPKNIGKKNHRNIFTIAHKKFITYITILIFL